MNALCVAELILLVDIDFLIQTTWHSFLNVVSASCRGHLKKQTDKLNELHNLYKFGRENQWYSNIVWFLNAFWLPAGVYSCERTILAANSLSDVFLPLLYDFQSTTAITIIIVLQTAYGGSI